MWIIPSSHPLYSAFVRDFLASKGDWKELSDRYKLQLMWKSKPLSVRTWLRGWNRVYWRRPLSGRILKPSRQNFFAKKFTASLADIHVSHSVPQVKERGPRMIDTFGRIYMSMSKQLNRHGVGLKMSPVIWGWDMTTFTKAFKALAMQLRLASLQRQKRAHLISDNDCSYWPLQTENCNTGAGKRMIRGPNNVRDCVINKSRQWPTPRASEHKDCGEKGSKSQIFRLNKRYLDATVKEMSGQRDEGRNNMNGKNQERLNPAWVAQLMGTTLEKTFFVPLATAW